MALPLRHMPSQAVPMSPTEEADAERAKSKAAPGQPTQAPPPGHTQPDTAQHPPMRERPSWQTASLFAPR
jgi:hypothetical protein